MIAVLTYLLALLGLGTGAIETQSAPPVCDDLVVTVWRDASTPCDLAPPTRLDIVGLSHGECMDAGGLWLAWLPDRPCYDVDY